MKKVFIKYNPYKLETEFTVDGRETAQNSRIGERILPGSRLQEWVEDLPKLLVDEYNDKDFEVVFHGTDLDYEDLEEIFRQAQERGELTVNIEQKKAKEIADKEAKIDDVFEKIQNGPFDELKDAEIISAFQHAKSSDFEVCVVATMSAGKSTLINAMLCNKLMPSSAEACTAIITKIKDTESKTAWHAEVYDKDGQLIETNEDLTYAAMERLNADEKVSMIKIDGDIPFVEAKDVSLVLVDTPGPNNARDIEHKKVQSEFLNKSSKTLVLYIMTATFGSDDDNALLKRVADSMKVGGKQSKDRFLFVVNKMDDRKKEDGDIRQTLGRITDYLNGHGIAKPNLFPAAALPALNVRLMQKCTEIDIDTEEDTQMRVRRLNRKENNLYLENYATLPASISGEIKKNAADANANKDEYAEALIHTGVISIEAAIRQYVQKYARTAKIKNIVDTFIHKLDELDCFEKTRQELARNQEYKERINSQIDEIKEKINDGESAKQFSNAVKNAVNKVRDEAKEEADRIYQKYQAEITQKIDELRGKDIDPNEVMEAVKELENFAKKLEPNFQVELDELIRVNLTETGEALLQEYKAKLASLTSEIDLNTLESISIDPLKLMGGSIPALDENSLTYLIQRKEVEDGEDWVKNTDKKWYKPWTWFQESGYYKAKYKTVKYISASDLAQEFFAQIQDELLENKELAQKYADSQSNRIENSFSKEVERLDGILKQKMSELKSCTTDKKHAEELIRETDRKRQWLEDIRNRVASILEI